jgi:hypothetical protein
MHLEAIFTKLEAEFLTLKPRKCRLAMAFCDFLGRVVGRAAKVAAVKEFAHPQIK